MVSHLHIPARLASGRLGAKDRGFALVITMALLVLLMVVSIGLLGLARIELGMSLRSRALSEAQADARLAVLMAIGQLQAELGSDQRVSAPADQLAGGNPAETAAGQGRRWWTGAYDAWPAGGTTRPTPAFRRWLVSGDPALTSVRDKAKDAPAADDLTMVSGPEADDLVKVPAVAVESDGKAAGRMGWWTADENQKALVAAAPPAGAVASEARGEMMAAPRTAFELARGGAGAAFAKVAPDEPALAAAVSWGQLDLVPGVERTQADTLSHDLTVHGRGMLTNVRRGGFRKDLSFHLEKPSSQAPKNPYYTIARTDPGINEEELWVYYNLWKDLKTSGAPSYTTGGRMGNRVPFLQMAPTPTACRDDDYFFYKQPAIVSWQVVYSMDAKPVTVGNQAMYRLRLVVDPILTYWNPLDVPVVMPTAAFNSVKYWQLPYDLKLTIGGRVVTVPISRLISPSDRNVMTVRAGLVQQIVMRPGEVLMVSQAARTPTTQYNPGRQHIDCTAGFNFGGGVAFEMKDLANATIDILPTDTVRYEVYPNTQTSGGPNGGSHSSYFSLTHHEWYVGEDRADRGDSLGFGGMCVDWGFGNARLKTGEVRPGGATATKPTASRMLATNNKDVFKGVTATEARPLSAAQLNGRKEPFMLFSFNLKTELGSDRPGRYLARFNRNALHNDFYDFTPRELHMVPFEVQVEALNSWRSSSIEVSPAGNGYLGGGHNAGDGTNILITHSVPREPIHSLGALQNSLANGFNMRRPTYGYATLNSREPMLPQVSHAIGNSMATPVLAPDKTEGTLAGGRPVADHSYLANQALFDDWFFSGIAPQTGPTFAVRRSQRQVADEWLNKGTPLPNDRYLARPGAVAAQDLLGLLFNGNTPKPEAAERIAAYLAVNGMFNVNSTSVQAWKAMLGSLKGRPVAVQETNGTEAVAETGGRVPAVGLLTPQRAEIDPRDLLDVKAPSQWTGYRLLEDKDIEALAEAVVREVRKRGPFLSLADFVNRRVGTDRELARCGALQAALDSREVGINDSLRGGRSVTASQAAAMAFPEAEEGPMAYGMPGCVKQGDVLTAIAPVLSARSDSFRIRGYGERTIGTSEKVRAWCEVVVERQPEFIDPGNQIADLTERLNTTNQRFGRRLRVVSFRWLAAEEV